MYHYFIALVSQKIKLGLIKWVFGLPFHFQNDLYLGIIIKYYVFT